MPSSAQRLTGTIRSSQRAVACASVIGRDAPACPTAIRSRRCPGVAGRSLPDRLAQEPMKYPAPSATFKIHASITRSRWIMKPFPAPPSSARNETAGPTVASSAMENANTTPVSSKASTRKANSRPSGAAWISTGLRPPLAVSAPGSIVLLRAFLVLDRPANWRGRPSDRRTAAAVMTTSSPPGLRVWELRSTSDIRLWLGETQTIPEGTRLYRCMRCYLVLNCDGRATVEQFGFGSGSNGKSYYNMDVRQYQTRGVSHAGVSWSIRDRRSSAVRIWTAAPASPSSSQKYRW